jgi:hypothetical protein
MTSVAFSVFLLLQTVSPAATKVVTGRLSVEGGAQTPSSIDLPLTAVGAAPTPTRTVLIRLQIDGSFQAQVPTGEYRVGAPGRLPPGYTLQSMAYGGVDLLRNPLKIASNDSAELVINLAVNGPSPAVSVSGRVTGIAPGEVLRIALRESSGGQISAALETNIGPDGSFTFPKVLPGNYLVYFRLRAQTRVTVADKDVTGVLVAVPQDILVSGHVIDEGASPISPVLIIEGNGKAATAMNRGTGTFILSLEKGENSISVHNIPETHRLKSITYGDVDLQQEKLKLDGPANWDIVVRLAPKN